MFVDAALTVFAEKSYAKSSVSDVCAVAGLSRRQFYEEYSSREELLVAAYDSAHRDARAAVEAELATTTSVDLREIIAAATTAYVGAMLVDFRRAKVSFVEIVGVSDAVEEHRARVREEWGRLIEAAVTGTPGSRTPPGGWRLAMAGFIGAVNGLAHQWSLDDPRPPIDTLIEVLLTLLSALVTPDVSPN